MHTALRSGTYQSTDEIEQNSGIVILQLIIKKLYDVILDIANHRKSI